MFEPSTEKAEASTYDELLVLRGKMHYEQVRLRDLSSIKFRDDAPIFEMVDRDIGLVLAETSLNKLTEEYRAKLISHVLGKQE